MQFQPGDFPFIKNGKSFQPGDFSFIKNDMKKAMLEDAYAAVTITQSWIVLQANRDDGTFEFSKAALDTMKKINTAMKYPEHSGTSYGWTIKCILYIGAYGWDSFVDIWQNPA